MISSSLSARRIAASGTTAAMVFSARSRSAAILAKEKPALRRLSTEAASTCCGVGNTPAPQEFTSRPSMVLAATPLSCW